MKVAYVRSSTQEQNNDYQILALKKFGIDKWFIEKKSGRNMKREELQNMLDFVREGDTVYIYDFSRLARSTKDLATIVDALSDKGVALVSTKEQLDTSTATGKLMLTMIGAINQFQVDIQREKQLEGIAVAKAEGKYKGRNMASVDAENWNSLLDSYKSREISKAKFAEALGVSRPTLDKLMKRYEAGEDIFKK